MWWTQEVQWAWTPGPGMQALGWMLLVVVGFWLFRTFAGVRGGERPPGDEKEVQHLRERYARGEITLDEFQDSVRHL